MIRGVIKDFSNFNNAMQFIAKHPQMAGFILLNMPKEIAKALVDPTTYERAKDSLVQYGLKLTFGSAEQKGEAVEELASGIIFALSADGVGTLAFDIVSKSLAEKSLLGKVGEKVLKEIETTESLCAKNSATQELKNLLVEYLGEETKFLPNKAGGPVFINEVRQRKVRFDVLSRHGAKKPHMHIEKINPITGEWIDETEIHQFFPGRH
jgi:hypothetical protein